MRRSGLAPRALVVPLVLALASCGDESHSDPPVVDASGPGFVGTAVCGGCHAQEAERWRGSHHDLAMQEATGASVLGDFQDASFTPGSEHVRQSTAAAQEASPEGDAGTGFVVRLRQRPPAEWVFDPGAAIARRTHERESNVELETCGRCHSRRALIRGTYRWGRPLLDSYRPALLDEPLYHADGQILDEVYVYGSFLQSRMHAAGVSCSDCHDPHALAVATKPDETCSGCHRPEVFAAPAHHFHEPGSTGASCVECHMPARTYMGVDARRDHSLRVPRPDLSLAIGTPNACTGCHPDRSASWAADVSERWWGPAPTARQHFATALHAGRKQLLGAAGSLSELVADVTQPGIARATALRLLRDQPGPLSLDAVTRGTSDADGLVRMAALEAAESIEPMARLRLAKPLLRDPVLAVRIEAARLLADTPPERLAPRERSALSTALAEYREAQLATEDGPAAHLNLGILHTRLGELERAREAYARALQLAPWFVPAYVNLADLHRQGGRDDEAERMLRRALELAPDSAEAHHALGLTLVRREDLEGALEQLARAVDLAPERPRYAYVYGVALHSASQSERAVEVLSESLMRHPGDRQLLTLLATLSRDLGRIDTALGYARELVERAPTDPSARSLLERLEAAAPQ